MPGLPESDRLRKPLFIVMEREQLLYLAPYAGALLLLAGIFLYAVRQPYRRGARPFAWLVGGQILTTFAFVFELFSPSLETKIFWDTVQWLTISYLVILPFLVFAVRFSEYRLNSPSLFWGLTLTFLGIFATFILTDHIHHRFYVHPQLTARQPFAELQYDTTLATYIYLLLYYYGATILGISLLIWRAFQPRNLFRIQYLIVAAGFMVPLIFSLLTLAYIQVLPQQDLMPFGFALGSLIAAWGVFHYGLPDIAPLARQHIVANLSEPVIVFDAQNRIIDVNKTALTLLEKQRHEIIGRTPELVFTRFPALVELVNSAAEQRKQISLNAEGRTLFIEASVSHILGPKREWIGRILMLRDHTPLKTMEADYQMLSRELEQRFQGRTEELHQTAERYRTIVENHPDFIVRWKPDGTRTFVNEAYCRYWAITREQALARNFLFHTPEEDRPAIEKNVVHLNFGASEIETEIHQVIRPDGNIAWQEWTDKAIRDEWGKLVEIQSIGRDITERKQAEETLNS